MGKKISFSSSNFPAMSLRHQDFRAKITEIHSPLDHADSSWKIVKALNGSPAAVSIESDNFPGHYIVHSSFEAWIKRPDGVPSFAADGSWLVRPGLTGAPGSVSFESTNFPGHFLRHEGFLLKIAPNDGSPLFAQDGTFAPHGDGAKKLLKHASPLGKALGKTTLTSHNFPAMRVRHQDYAFKITPCVSKLDKSDAKLMVVPGLNGDPRCVSFTSKVFPGFYFRHSGFVCFLHKNDASPLFAADASFFLRPGLADPAHSISLVSANFPDRFLRHEGFILKLAPNDGSPLFAADATFKPKGKAAKRLLRISHADAVALGDSSSDSSSSSSSDSD